MTFLLQQTGHSYTRFWFLMAISSFTSRFMPPLKSVVVSGIEATRN